MIIQVFIANVFLIYGFQNAYKQGNILGFLPTLINWHPKLMKPLFFCSPCMASIYGLFGFIYADLFWSHSWYYPVWMVCLSGAIVIINKFSLK